MTDRPVKGGVGSGAVDDGSSAFYARIGYRIAMVRSSGSCLGSKIGDSPNGCPIGMTRVLPAARSASSFPLDSDHCSLPGISPDPAYTAAGVSPAGYVISAQTNPANSRAMATRVFPAGTPR